MGLCAGLRPTIKNPLKRSDRVFEARSLLPVMQARAAREGGGMNQAGWRQRTVAVHGGARRSQYGEMAEAIYLTQGFAYPSAEAAEARFIKAGADEFIYARYGNPTNIYVLVINFK